MKNLNNYYTNTIKYNLINRYNYIKIDTIPKVKKIILSFNCKSSTSDLIATCFLALELLSNQKVFLIQTKKANIVLKLRKGCPIGCKVVLQRKQMYFFIKRLIFEILPKMKLKDKIIYKDQSQNNSAISYHIPNLMTFFEFENNYSLFSDLLNLQITFITNTKTKNELIFLLNSLKIPFKETINSAKIAQLVEFNLAKIKVEGSNPFFCYF